MHIKTRHLIIAVSFSLSCVDSTPPTHTPQVRVDQETGGTNRGGEVTGGEPSINFQAGTSEDIQAGQVTPEGCGVEICDALDNDCDGQADEDLICSCSEDSSCYSGPPETRNIGVCTDGARECGPNREQWLECTDSITPTLERCDELDNDCDGLVDEMMGQACGECVRDGSERCDGIDNDCDGVIDEELVRPCPCSKNENQVQVCSQGIWEGCEGETGRSINSGTVMIELPALPPNCPFDTGDNLREEGGQFCARVEQVADFELPPGAQLCAFSLSGSNENFYFDDELMLLMNNVPLISSVNFASQFEIIDGLPRYDWLRIRGRSADEVGDNATCLEGAVNCLIPGTQSNGELSVSFDVTTNVRLANTSDRGDYQFKVVITGDNDPDLDCSHTGLTLQVNYDYLIE